MTSRSLALLSMLPLWYALPAVFAVAQEEVAPRFPELEFRKWSGEINVPDPVAVTVDQQGRVFVTQTQRRKVQDLDIRQHRQWIPDDVGLRSVEDKRKFLRRQLAIGGDQERQRRHVDDHNQDGQFDWRDLTVISEVIYRLVDSDRDGTADEITVFAEDFKTEVTGIAAGVLAFEGDVWATIAPDVWRLRDENNDGVADTRHVVAHGFGLHIAYGGHDMHGLTVGPDGKIYWSIGDKGIHVTTDEGTEFAYPNQGGVMRCNPDGSDFEVFAHGLRNVQEFAFDQYGNLFGVDNDSDQPNERERFVYIVSGMDAGWRCHYQYRGSSYNPWTAERLWELPADDHPAYIVPPLSHFVDGPAGFKFNPGTALSPHYQDFFFMTSAPNGFQYAFRVEPHGDAFRMVDDHRIGSGLAIVGLAFGPDGALYGADWDGGYPLDQKGSVVRIDVPGSDQAPQRVAVRELLADGFDSLPKKKLQSLLSHADQRVRLGAQFALVRQQAFASLDATARDTQMTVVGRLHGLWGLGQLARAGNRRAIKSIAALLGDAEAHVRGQAAKTYGEIQDADGKRLVGLVDDPDPHVRTLAGLALARRPSSEATEPLLRQADRLPRSDHYVRHSIVSALSSCATASELAAQATHTSEMRRLCSALALRRQSDPAVTVYLSDASNWIATEAARAIHDDRSIPDAVLPLAKSLLDEQQRSEAYWRRAINANFCLGDAAAAGRLLEYATATWPPDAMRVAALESLSVWHNPPVLDRVEGVRRDLPVENRQMEDELLRASLSHLASAESQEIRAAAIVAARQLHVTLPADVLHAIAVTDGNDSNSRIEALSTLASSGYAQLKDVLLVTLESDEATLRSHTLELFVKHFPPDALPVIERLLETDRSPVVRQTCVSALPQLPEQSGRKLLLHLGRQLIDGELDSRLALDVMEALAAAPRRPEGDVASVLAQLQANRESRFPGAKLAQFAYSRDGGDAAAGAELFRTHVQAQCSRCHRTGRQGSEIGPELTKIARKRDADYILRSILQPSADIDEKYRTQMLLLESGQVVKGVIQSQDDETTIVADSEGQLLTVASDEIEELVEQNVSLMPTMTEVLSPREVRDLVAYLRSLR